MRVWCVWYFCQRRAVAKLLACFPVSGTLTRLLCFYPNLLHLWTPNLLRGQLNRSWSECAWCLLSWRRTRGAHVHLLFEWNDLLNFSTFLRLLLVFGPLIAINRLFAMLKPRPTSGFSSDSKALIILNSISSILDIFTFTTFQAKFLRFDFHIINFLIDQSFSGRHRVLAELDFDLRINVLFVIIIRSGSLHLNRWLLVLVVDWFFDDGWFYLVVAEKSWSEIDASLGCVIAQWVFGGAKDGFRFLALLLLEPERHRFLITDGVSDVRTVEHVHRHQWLLPTWALWTDFGWNNLKLLLMRNSIIIDFLIPLR